MTTAIIEQLYNSSLCMEKYIYYCNAYSTRDYTKVIVHLEVVKNEVIEPDNIVDRDKAEYQTKNIVNVLAIKDKNNNNYISAYDLNTDDDFVFTTGKSLNLENPIKIYLNQKVCLSKQLKNKIKKINIHNEKGELMMNGVTFNGIFTGTLIDNENKLLYIKNGLQINNI